PDDEFLSRALGRCMRDLYILQQRTSAGVGIAAGLPWYPALFGRDPAIAALQWLHFFPAVARGVVKVNAFFQGQSDDAATDRPRGKIHTERQGGDRARWGATKFAMY